ncbi:hypothetical protein [Bradyrhizobium sp. CCGB20]|uniref:hypothetical protein n=1 Tax=Bradyrhizobium sp. CCGB20 TaxID=2949633 RepID=UPI0020B4088D|nr:hypothetical protein [Bradyrhizobium sp. CCGB20]MCP3402424.1 hypothetical protein [Bradyrhizobium sp. CCGB20]
MDRGGKMMGWTCGVRCSSALSRHRPASAQLRTGNGRSNIPEAPTIELRGRGVLDAPVKPGMTAEFGATRHNRPHAILSLFCPTEQPIISPFPNLKKINDFCLIATVHGLFFAFFV